MSKQFYSVKQVNSVSIMQEDNNKENMFQLKGSYDAISSLAFSLECYMLIVLR